MPPAKHKPKFFPQNAIHSQIQMEKKLFKERLWTRPWLWLKTISIARRSKLRFPSLCLASLNPIQTTPITTVEMALTRRLAMATVALIAFATAAFVAAPADAAKEKRAFIRSTVKAHDIVIFSKSNCPGWQ